jgi:hypothetical protein
MICLAGQPQLALGKYNHRICCLQYLFAGLAVLIFALL